MKNILGNKYKILERKSSKFGVVGVVDRGTELQKGFSIPKSKTTDYYDNTKRFDIYRTALDKYVHDQLAHPIINLIAGAIFHTPPDFQGDKELVDRARTIVGNSFIDWFRWGVTLEVHGDFFLRIFRDNDYILVPIPSDSITVDFDETNMLNIRNYIQFEDKEGEENISPDKMVHFKVNGTDNMVYGSSTLRPAMWWFDVLDNLWERVALRAAQYYGAPVAAIAGIPPEHQAAVKASLEADGQRPGRNWVFSEGVTVDTLDFTKNYPIQDLIDRAYQYILSSCNIPQHLIYESDSSRGVAMFSGDAFEMMIRSRQRQWSLGIERTFRLIFEEEGLWKENSKFLVKFAPVFRRDLKDLTSMVEKAMGKGLLSNQTAREKIGVDHSEEIERLKRQKTEEPEAIANPLALQKQMADDANAAKDKQVPTASGRGAD